MGSKYQILKGMDDFLPGEIEKWQWLENKARIFFEAQGYKEIRTPILEPLELFIRSLGDGSDIVHKEMYAFKDRGGREIVLRPEMTASVARAVIENHLLKKSRLVRLYYVGPMFRGERPQAGRKRQFHQIGIELVGEPASGGDTEAISILIRFLRYVGLEKVELQMNHLGCPKDRPSLTAALKDYFSKEKDKLCSDCHYRLEHNVLRVFDCKNPDCQPVIQKAPWEDLCANCQAGWEEVQKKLKTEHGIDFKVEKRLVRGMDYYTGTVFEVVAEGLGAQDAVAGGGRYDGLYESLGGDAAAATGFSIGMERLLKALEETGKDPLTILQSQRIYFASLVRDPKERAVAQEQALRLREAGFSIEVTPDETSLSVHLKHANQLGLRYVLICGEDELKQNKISLKDLEKHTQKEINLAELLPVLRELV